MSPLLPFLAAQFLTAPAAAPAQFGPWSLECRRAGAMAGRAYESCEAKAMLGNAAVLIERDAHGLTGLLVDRSCKTGAKGIFRMNRKALADPAKRSAKFAKAVNLVLRQCGQPEIGLLVADTEALLQGSDGLSADWIG